MLDTTSGITALMDTLRHRLLKLAPSQGRARIANERILINRYDQERVSPNSLGRPSLCLVVQGEKTMSSDDETLACGEGEFLAFCSVRPRAVRMKPAGKGRPFLSITAEFDRMEASRMVDDIADPVSPAGGSSLEAIEGYGAFYKLADGTVSAPASANLLSAFNRLLAATENPDYVHVLAPRCITEITQIGMAGPLGLAVRDSWAVSLHSGEIADAISWMRHNCTATLDVAELASRVGMGLSTFHRHFKEETTLSPLQFHKVLRLNAARRHMLQDGQSSSEAAVAAGYKSSAQFCRDYARMFGVPPHRDMVQSNLWRQA